MSEQSFAERVSAWEPAEAVRDDRTDVVGRIRRFLHLVVEIGHVKTACYEAHVSWGTIRLRMAGDEPLRALLSEAKRLGGVRWGNVARDRSTPAERREAAAERVREHQRRWDERFVERARAEREQAQQSSPTLWELWTRKRAA